MTTRTAAKSSSRRRNATTRSVAAEQREALTAAIEHYDKSCEAEAAREDARRGPSRRGKAATRRLFRAIASAHGVDPDAIAVDVECLEFGRPIMVGAVRHRGRTYFADHLEKRKEEGERRGQKESSVTLLDESRILTIDPARRPVAAAVVEFYKAASPDRCGEDDDRADHWATGILLDHIKCSDPFWPDSERDRDYVAAFRYRGKLYIYTGRGDAAWVFCERYVLVIAEDDILDV